MSCQRPSACHDDKNTFTISPRQLTFSLSEYRRCSRNSFLSRSLPSDSTFIQENSVSQYQSSEEIYTSIKEKEIVPSLVCRLHKHWISSNWRYCKLHLIVRNSFLPPARTEQTGNSQKLEKLMKSWKLITGGDWSLN